MLEKKLSVAAGHNITVTNAAAKLLDLMDTAASDVLGLPDSLDCAEICAEDGDIRVLADGGTPTGDVGTLVVTGSCRTFKGNPVSRIRVIRETSMSSNVKVSVRVGWSDSENV